MSVIPPWVYEQLANSGISESVIKQVVSAGLGYILRFLNEKGSDIPPKVREWLQSLVREEWERGEYAFPQYTSLAENLLATSSQESLGVIKQCIGSHHGYVDIMRIGLLINKYNDLGEKEKVKGLRQDIFEEYGREGMHVNHIVTTGLLDPVAEWIKEEKEQQNLSKEEAAERFAEFLQEWENNTIFHKAETPDKKLEGEILRMMDLKREIFLLFAYARACDSAFRVMDMLKKDSTFTVRGYDVEQAIQPDGAGYTKCAWIFRKKD